MFKVNKVYAAIVQTQNGSHLFSYAAFWGKKKKGKNRRKTRQANKQTNNPPTPLPFLTVLLQTYKGPV